MAFPPPQNSLRVGFVGAADIGRLVWSSIHTAGHHVSIIGCRDHDRGKQYVKEVCDHLKIPEEQRPRVGSYEDVVTAAEVDVVYIGIPVTQRHPWVMKCAANGKHVVCEKPPAPTPTMLQEWVDALHAKDLLYMDGTMCAHSRRIGEVCKTVHSLGPVKHIYASFGTPGSKDFLENDIRVDPTLEPHGALGDLGWYCIRSILWIMDFNMPTEVTGRIIKQNEKGAVLEFSGELLFDIDGNVTMASFFCAFDSCWEDVLHVATTNAVVEVKDFAFPLTGKSAQWRVVRRHSHHDVCAHHQTRSDEVFQVDGEETATQRDRMWANVGNALSIDKGRLKVKSDEAKRWSSVALQTLTVVDKVLASARAVQPVAAVA